MHLFIPVLNLAGGSKISRIQHVLEYVLKVKNDGISKSKVSYLQFSAYVYLVFGMYWNRNSN